MDKPVSFLPTDGLTYDPSEEKYWDEQSLGKEVNRVFEVCNGCRMCFKYCDSFPIMFKFIDEKHDGNVGQLQAAEIDRVMNACFQCKLCEVQCPYTVRDKHDFQLDFPNLVHRYQAVKAKKNGVSLRDKLLGDPDRLSRFARLSFGMSNFFNKISLFRFVLEKILKIHRHKLLPEFATQTFESWAMKQRLDKVEKPEAVIFQSCYVNNNQPQVGKDTVHVLQKNSVAFKCEKGLECCGMPAWEHGDLGTLRRHARHNLEMLVPQVKAGAKVIVLHPTCTMMLRKEYKELVEPPFREDAELLSSAVMDAGEFLWSIREEERFNADLKTKPESVVYHAPCHQRAQQVGFKSRDLIRKLTGVNPKTVLECSGHNGTYSMKVEGYASAKRVGKKSFDELQNSEAEVWLTECPQSSLQFLENTGHPSMHPMTFLKKCYEGESFSK